MTFSKSKKIGDFAERETIKNLKEHGLTVKKSDCLSVDIVGHNITFEVKYDIMSKVTKNLAFEVFNTKLKKKSGLAATKASYWVHFLNEPWFITVQNLKILLIKYAELTKLVHGGDDNSFMVLIPIYFIRFFADAKEFSSKK